MQQYDRLKARGAFLEQFKKEKMFSEGLEEFDDAREVWSFQIWAWKSVNLNYHWGVGGSNGEKLWIPYHCEELILFDLAAAEIREQS